MTPARRLEVAFLFAALAFAGPAQASAAGGRYVVEGATPAETAEIHLALDASAFNWSLVRARVTIHVRRGLTTSFSLPGQIWLDADLLDAGQFSWGVVQMEYAQQVHFMLFDDPAREQLRAALGAEDWCYGKPGVAAGDQGCERFAATLAWAYWPSPANSLKPVSSSDWSAAMPPAVFRELIRRLLGTGVIAATAADSTRFTKTIRS